ncbi:MAG: hypothetical protein WCP32_12240 [Bacteroidota bacterium]
MLTKNEISVKAFNMFRDWTKNVQQKYTELNLKILDETILVNDLIASANAAKKSLLKEESKEKRKQKGFDTGFILGFINSNLNMHWDYEYIIKQSAEYKEFIAIKAIKIYLEFETLTAIRIKNIYTHLLTEDTNLQNIDVAITKEKFKELSFLEPDNFPTNEIIVTLDNKIKQYLNTYFKRNVINFMEPCEHYFSDIEIQDIINKDLYL